MAVKQSASFTGVDDRKLRLGKIITMQDVEDVASDQAFLYETTVGFKVPTASAISATPHIHDSTNGHVLPIPLAHGVPNVDLRAQSASATVEGFSKLLYTPVYIPTGVTKVVWVGLSGSIHTRNYLRGNMQDDTLVDVSVASNPEGGDITGIQGLYAMRLEMDTVPGEVNILSLECWDGYTEPEGTGIVGEGRDLISWALYPIEFESPKTVLPWTPPQIVATDVVVPGSTQHLGVNAFTSMDAGFFTDKRSINSWLCQGLSLNDALLHELIIGRPVGGNEASHSNNNSYKGHSHGGESLLTNCGALMEQTLLSVSYGVARTFAASSGHMDDDMQDSTERAWIGHIHAPTIITGGGGAVEQEVSRHGMALPALDADYALDTSGGTTTKIKGAMLVRLNTSKATSATFRMGLRSHSGGTVGAKVSVVNSTNGLRLLQFDDLDASNDPGDDGIMQQLRIYMEQVGTSYPACCIYGFTVWLST